MDSIELGLNYVKEHKTLLVEMNQVKHTSVQVEAIKGRLQQLVDQFTLTEDRVR